MFLAVAVLLFLCIVGGTYYAVAGAIGRVRSEFSEAFSDHPWGKILASFWHAGTL